MHVQNSVIFNALKYAHVLINVPQIAMLNVNEKKNALLNAYVIPSAPLSALESVIQNTLKFALGTAFLNANLTANVPNNTLIAKFFVWSNVITTVNCLYMIVLILVRKIAPQNILIVLIIATVIVMLCVLVQMSVQTGAKKNVAYKKSVLKLNAKNVLQSVCNVPVLLKSNKIVLIIVDLKDVLNSVRVLMVPPIANHCAKIPVP